MKRFVPKFLLIILVYFVVLSGTCCGKNTQGTLTDAVPLNTQINNTTTETTPLESSEPTSVQKTKTDSANDTERGLLNIKPQDKSDFSDIEKLIIEYFDTDYFRAPDYDNLQRYPKVYKGSQICFLCSITEILQEDDDNFTILGRYQDLYDQNVAVKGTLNDARLITGDKIYVYGKYTGIDNYVYEGKSYKVPTIVVNRYTYADVGYILPLFSHKDIKKLAEYIFGDVIISDINDTEYWNPDADYSAAYVVELENQSNANFTKYEFNAAEGKISDLKSTDAEERTISFSADFDHFFVKNFNHTLNSFTLSCYTRELKKIWTEEFEDTTSASFDCTTNSIYLIANGYMYIIDASTGEDVFAKKYVGQKTGIRKVEDGIILIAETPTEAIMKTDLQGNVLWTVDAEFGNRYNEVIQIVGNNIVYSYSFTDYAEYDKNYVLSGDRAMVVSPEGEVLESVKLPVENYTYNGPSTVIVSPDPPKNNVNTFSGYCWTTDYLNVRSGPGTNYRVLEVLSPNSKVYVYGLETDRSGGIWAQIGDGEYVNGDYLVYYE